jgi:hypothetical protein
MSWDEFVSPLIMALCRIGYAACLGGTVPSARQPRASKAHVRGLSFKIPRETGTSSGPSCHILFWRLHVITPSLPCLSISIAAPQLGHDRAASYKMGESDMDCKPRRPQFERVVENIHYSTFRRHAAVHI